VVVVVEGLNVEADGDDGAKCVPVQAKKGNAGGSRRRLRGATADYASS